jgi:serine/threonine-protein kinase
MSDPEIPALIAGRYRPLRLIGKGGMGVVYEVEHTHTGQHLALKVLARQASTSTERFKREARAASSIQSDHIVRVTDADVAAELEGAPFLVMELLEGEDLEVATGDRPAAPEDVIDWLRQVARALDKAHARGIVHRDLKPANLFLTRREDGSALVKILDFGIAKMSADAATLTQSDTFLGTPGFMAPEQTDSKGSPVTFRSDLYALGLIAFRLLTGRGYWKTGTLVQLLAQILVEPMPPPSERGSTLGPAFDAWFLRACDRDAGSRFPSAREQVEALAVALGLPELHGLVDTGPRKGVVPPLQRQAVQALGSAATFNASASDVKSGEKTRSRRRWLAVGLLTVLAALGVAVTRMQGGAGPGQGTAVGSSAAETGVPIARPPVGLDPSGIPPAAGPSVLAEPGADAALPSLSSAHTRPIPMTVGSAPRRVGAPSPSTAAAASSEKGSPASPRRDGVWTER